MSTYICTLDDKAKQYSKEKLNETEENRTKCLEEIRDWLASNNHLNAYTGILSEALQIHITVRWSALYKLYLSNVVFNNLILFSDTYSLLMFLRSSKFMIDATEKKLNAFYNFKTATPEWFEKRDPLLPEIQSLLKTG